jgi:tetratricopeptide (TPR) repeat protein
LDKAAVLKEVQKHLAKGAVDKAISELDKLVKETPDGNTFNMIGDLYLRKGSQKSAIEFYQKAANYFRQEGFYQKAQALYKKILNLNAADAGALYAFGELSEEKGLVTDAIKYYLATADILSKEGKKDRILGIYEKILSLSPSNIPLRTKVAEIFIREGLEFDASREYSLIAVIHEEKGDFERSREFFRKSLDLNPRNKVALSGLSLLYEKTGDITQAAAQMKNAAALFPEDPDILLRSAELSLLVDNAADAKQFLVSLTKKDPKNVRARRMLGELYLKAGSAEKAWEQYLPVLGEILAEQNHEDAINLLRTFKPVDPVETCTRLISLFKQLGENDSACDELISLGDYYSSAEREDDARSCFAEALRINPEHSLAGQRLAHPPAEPEHALDNADTISSEAGTPDLEESPEEAGEVAGPAALAGRETLPVTPTGIPETEEKAEPDQIVIQGEKSFDEIITEVDIFARYGLVNEAQNLLESLKSRFPQNIDVHVRLKTLYRDIGEKELAVTECIILSGLYQRRGDETGASEALKEAYEISPEDPRIVERGLAQLVGPASNVAVSSDLGAAETQIEPVFEDYEEEITEADFYFRQGLITEAVKILEKLQGLFPRNPAIMERLEALGQTASLPDDDTLAGKVGLPDSLDMGGPSDAPGEPDITGAGKSAEEFEMIGRVEEGGGSELPEKTEVFGRLEPKEGTSPGPEKEEGISGKTPQKAASEEVPPAKGPETEVPEEIEYEDFTLSESDLIEAQEMPEPALDNDVLEIFQEFKKGLEKELGDEDSETHYNLGIAYKEMGLVDDAIKEFQTSRNDEKRFLQSSTMLGVCYIEKGLYSLAIDVLQSALLTMKDKDDSYWALRYELAEAYEKNRNLKEALALYTEIYGWNAKFRSVSDKLSQLQPQTPRPAEQDKEKSKEQPKERKNRVSYL